MNASSSVPSKTYSRNASHYRESFSVSGWNRGEFISTPPPPSVFPQCISVGCELLSPFGLFVVNTHHHPSSNRGVSAVVDKKSTSKMKWKIFLIICTSWPTIKRNLLFFIFITLNTCKDKQFFLLENVHK